MWRSIIGQETMIERFIIGLLAGIGISSCVFGTADTRRYDS